MPATATATYFVKTFTGATRLDTGTLFDLDLTRGDDAGEGISRGNGTQRLFDGVRTFQQTGPGPLDGVFVEASPDILATVTFADGTTLQNVRGLYDFVSQGYGLTDQVYLLDPAALASAGKTLADVVDVTRTSFTEHGLDWSDFGITGTPATPVLPPPPPPPPVLNRIEGTSGRDVLAGTSGDDLIIGNGGRDRLTGRAGDDTFVFGEQAANGVRDVTTITDYDAFDDTILLTDGARLARYTEKGDTVTLFLTGGDGDRIILQNVPDSGPLFKLLVDDDFLV